MLINTKLLNAAVVISFLELSSQAVGAVSITPIDLDTVQLGAQIVGPVGPTVDASLIDDGNSLGDLSSSVSCPANFLECIPSLNPEGTIYTYIHEVTPGVDFLNDPPFSPQLPVVPFDDVQEFRLNFRAYGFTGEAGYSFGEAEAALGSSGEFLIDFDNNGQLVWTVASSNGWSTNANTPETISFFWQTTQPPVGPLGSYTASNDTQSGTGIGPLPAVPVPEPTSILSLLALGSLGAAFHRALF